VNTIKIFNYTAGFSKHNEYSDTQYKPFEGVQSLVPQAQLSEFANSPPTLEHGS